MMALIRRSNEKTIPSPARLCSIPHVDLAAPRRRSYVVVRDQRRRQTTVRDSASSAPTAATPREHSQEPHATQTLLLACRFGTLYCRRRREQVGLRWRQSSRFQIYGSLTKPTAAPPFRPLMRSTYRWPKAISFR